MIKIRPRSPVAFLLGIIVASAIVILDDCLGFAMKAGLDVLFGGENFQAINEIRAHWVKNFSVCHFVAMGFILYVSNMVACTDNELVHVLWPTKFVSQVAASVLVLVGLFIMELLAYLIQFVGNAIYVAITNWTVSVSVTNTISLKYLLQKMDIAQMICEAFIASQFIAFFDRKRRRKIAEEARMSEEDKHHSTRKLYLGR